MATATIKKAKTARKPKATKASKPKVRRGLPQVGDMCVPTKKEYRKTTAPRDNSPRPMPKALKKGSLPSFFKKNGKLMSVGERILIVLKHYGTIDRDNVHNLIGTTNSGTPLRILHRAKVITEVKDDGKCGVVTLKTEKRNIAWFEVRTLAGDKKPVTRVKPVKTAKNSKRTRRAKKETVKS